MNQVVTIARDPETLKKNRFRCLRRDVPTPQRQHRSISAPPYRDLPMMPPVVRCFNVHLKYSHQLPHISISVLPYRDLVMMPPAVRCHIFYFEHSNQLSHSSTSVLSYRDHRMMPPAVCCHNFHLEHLLGPFPCWNILRRYLLACTGLYQAPVMMHSIQELGCHFSEAKSIFVYPMDCPD